MNLHNNISVPTDMRNNLDEYANSLYTARKDALSDRDIDLDEYTRRPVDEEQVVIDRIEDEGYTCVGVGAARVVFTVPDDCAETAFVVKLARFGGGAETSDGFIQNGYEADLFTRATDTQRLALVPVVATADDHPGWILMPEVTPLKSTAQSSEEKYKRVMTLLADLESLGLASNLHLAEISQENTAMYEGNLRVFDYGHRALKLDVQEFNSEEAFQEAISDADSDGE